MEKNGKILVVDDSIMITSQVERILKSETMELKIAHDGKQAMQTVMDFQPDLILLDVELPDTNGFTLYEEIQKRAPQNTKIIFLTSRDDHDAVLTGMTLGASDYIKKPFDADELLIRIMSQLRTKHKDDELQKMEEKASVLHNLAFRDALTGLLNRNYVDQKLKNTLDINIPMMLIIADIDDFKYVNDYFGHEIGDMVLIGIASTLAATAAKWEVIRWGGEEFLIVFKGVTQQDCTEVAEQIRYAVEHLPFHSNGEDFHCTLTQGITCYDHALTFSENVEMADKALYYGKRHGKNCFICYEHMKDLKAGEVL